MGRFKGLHLSSPGNNYENIKLEESKMWENINEFVKTYFEIEYQEG